LRIWPLEASTADDPVRWLRRPSASGPQVRKYIPGRFSGLLCAGKTGMVKGMKESNDEGVATHIVPESCGIDRKDGTEALTGVRTGQVLSRENRVILRDADAVGGCGRQHPARRYRETRRSPARSQTLCTSGITMHGSREIPGLPTVRGTGGRDGKPKGEIRR